MCMYNYDIVYMLGFCGYEVIMVVYDYKPLLDNLRSNYEKTQGLNGAFLRLENQYLCRVSNACIHLKPSATFSDEYRWPNFTRSLG